MTRFDHNTTVIWGAGCAGTLLALELKRLQPNHSIHLFDSRTNFNQNQRWCFFNPDHSLKIPGTTHHWNRWKVLGKRPHRFQSERYTYTHVDSPRFFQSAHQQLNAYEDVHFHLGDLIEPDLSDPTAHRFKFQDSSYESSRIVDARGISKNNTLQDGLYQSFLGIITQSGSHSTKEAPVLMDFNVPQHLGITFLYQLPLENGRLLSELTVFSPQKTPLAELESALGLVCQERGIPTVCSDEREQGIIPMSVALPADKQHPLRTGAAGGALRPSTGYGFLGAYRQAQDMAKHLLLQKPIATSGLQHKYSYLDGIFLKVCKKHPEIMPDVFEQMFSGNHPDTMASFLSETSSNLQVASLIRSLPKWPFLKEALDPLLHAPHTGRLCHSGYGS